jgi:Uma2 family endonuclease
MDTDLVLSTSDLTARWRALSDDPESPDHFEINQYGEIVLAPKPSTLHQRRSFKVALALQAQLGPEAVTEVGVMTDQGVRVPDAVWMPPERWAQANDATPLQFVPDICVEVLSPGNTRPEIEMKKNAYLRGGAREVAIVELDGSVAFFGAEGRRAASSFGLVIELV